MNQKIQGILGLCARAGQLVSGEMACDQAIKKRKAALIIVDEAASANTQKSVKDACRHYKVPMEIASAGLLGKAIGKPGRMVCAITQGGLADKLIQLMQEHNKMID